MSDPLLPYELVATRLAIDPKLLVRYEQFGLIHSTQDAGISGFRSSDIPRIWSIVTYQRDLGVNLAGVEVVLKLREQRDQLQYMLARLTMELENTRDEPEEPAHNA